MGDDSKWETIQNGKGEIALPKKPNLTADYTDNADLHGSKKFKLSHFEFVGPCNPCSSVVGFCVFWTRPSEIPDCRR